MKKTIPMLMLLAAAFLASCGDDAPSCRLVSSTYDGMLYKEYIYDESGLLSRTIYYLNGQEDYAVHIERNPDKTVSEFIAIDNGDTLTRQLLTYSGGHPIKMDYLVDPDLDGTFEVFIFAVYSYNPAGKLVRTDVTDNNAQTYTYTYEWTGENMTRQTDVDGSYKIMQYDEYSSPSSWIFFESYEGHTGDIGSSFSMNNAILYTGYNDQGEQQSATSIVYTYNEQGFPVSWQSSQSAIMVTYDYNCE